MQQTIRELIRQPYTRIMLALFLGLVMTLLLVERPVKVERRIVERQQTLGKSAPTHWLVPVWTWRGLVANTGIAALLLCLAPLVNRPQKNSRPNMGDALPRSPAISQRQWLWIGAACVIQLSHTVPRLDHSLWGDEEYAMKSYIAPTPLMQEDGSWQLQPKPWMTTFFEFSRPTNHQGFTVLARASHDLFFRPTEEAESQHFSERFMRLPALLAGLGSIFALVWCLRVWGLQRGVEFLALAYVGHAWVIRYGSDARGYSLTLLLMPLLIGSIGMALQSNRWRWWLAMAAVQFYLFWTHTSVIYALLAAHLGVAVHFLTRKPLPAVIGRWLAANLLSLMLVIALMAPIVEPLLAFMGKNVLAGSLDTRWLLDAAAYLATGVPWFHWEAGNPLCASLAKGPLPAWVSAALLGLAAVTALRGIWIMARQRRLWPLLLFVILSPALLLTHLWVGGTKPYHWYLTPYLPMFFILLAAGWQPAQEAVRTTQTRSRLTWLAVFLTLGIHALALPSNQLLSRYPIEACRESVALTRRVTNPRHPDFAGEVITASPGMTTEAYDPAVRRFFTVQELEDLILEAKEKELPLFLNFGGRGILEPAMPDIFQIIDHSGRFERTAKLYGQFGPATREVWQLR